MLHSGLDEESYNKLVQKFVQMLASSHATSCPFHSHASRWFRAIDRCTSTKEDAKNSIVSKNENDPELLARQIRDALVGSGSNDDFYVPPYLLAISDEFLRFEDRTIDGSFTREIVEKGAAQICNDLRMIDVIKTQLQVSMPGTVKDFATSLRPGIGFDYVLQNAPIILSAFGWLVDEKKTIFECSYLTLKCNLCQSTPMLKLSRRLETEASTKKGRGSHFAPDFNPIDSHKYYCPYKSGFGFSCQSEMPGWKVVLSNLMKSTTTLKRMQKDVDFSLEGDDNPLSLP